MPAAPASSPPAFRLIVEPMCGLCNRLRVLDGALALAAAHHGVVEVVWFCDADLNCRFTDLFEPLPATVRFRHHRLPPLVEMGFKHVLHAWLKRTCGRYLLQYETEKLAAESHDFTELAAHRKVFLKTWSRFHPTESPFAVFRPVPHLQAMIDREAAALADVVGVHIRRTDFSREIHDITTEKFVARMKEELRATPEARFFLATDDPAEERFMAGLFPGKIITYRKRTLDRNRREGIEDAVVDLYCLARCRKLLGSRKSSFSETAAAMSRREAVLLG